MLENMLLCDCFGTTFGTNALALVMENSKGHGTGHAGKSSNLKIVKEYELCRTSGKLKNKN